MGKSLGRGYITEDIIDYAERMGAKNIPVDRIAEVAEVTPGTVRTWFSKGKSELEHRSELIEAGREDEVDELSLFGKFYLAYKKGDNKYRELIFKGIEEANSKGKYKAGFKLLEDRETLGEGFKPKSDDINVNINTKYQDMNKKEMIEAIVKKAAVAKMAEKDSEN